MSSPEARAEALRALAALLRAGLSPHAALSEWHREAPSSLAPELRGMSRRLALGDAPDRSIAELDTSFGSDARAVAAALSVHMLLGGNLPRVLDRLASSIDSRCASERAGRAASAGALLSGRVVAGLPLLMLPLAPFARAPMIDPAGLLMLVTGLALALAGLVWIGRLVPRPPAGDDSGAVFSDIVAGALAGGAPLDWALDAAARACPLDLVLPLARARRLITLGASWPDALARSGDELLTEVAGVIDRARRFGTPLADALEAHAERRRINSASQFEASLRRAPVLMVLPLSFCVLPAYAVLGLGPYLRSMSIG